MSKIPQPIGFRQSLVLYLDEVRKLSSEPASEDALTSLEELTSLREAVKRLASCPRKKFQIPFEEKTGERFRAFAKRLTELNSSPIYIWTDAANRCGLFQVSSLSQLKLDFPYDINPQGIVVLLARDVRDRMIWDFSEDGATKVLEVELIGETWPQAQY